jgi:DNA polymerase elongation subunit (family B)
MTIKQVKEFLKDNPGYLKCGDVRIADRLNIDLDMANLAKREVKEELQYREKEGPNILTLDIETAPLKASLWGIWQQNVNLDAIESDWFILSWSAKWLHEKNSFGEVLTSEEAINEDDSRIIINLWLLLEEADIVVTHNGDKFDIKRINTRFIEHGLGPTTAYKSIDTLKVVKKNFNFTSNKLDFIAKKFGIEGKCTTELQLWLDCIAGNEKALEEMLIYNIRDTVITEKIYLKLLPWIKNHPNIGLYNITDDKKCPNCGSNDLHDAGYSTSSIGLYKNYRCNKCGTISRERTTSLTTKENKNIIVQVK